MQQKECTCTSHPQPLIWVWFSTGLWCTETFRLLVGHSDPRTWPKIKVARHAHALRW